MKKHAALCYICPDWSPKILTTCSGSLSLVRLCVSDVIPAPPRRRGLLIGRQSSGGWLRLVSSYLQAGLEKCPLEKMTPLKGAENSRLTDIPLFSQVTSRPVHIFRTISSADYPITCYFSIHNHGTLGSALIEHNNN